MVTYPTWLLHYERGLDHLRTGDVDRALQAFDEVYETSKGHIRPLRFRSGVLDWLERRMSARLAPAQKQTFDGLGVQDKERELFAYLASLPLHLQTWALCPRAAALGVPMTFQALQLVELALRVYRTEVEEQAERNRIDFLPPEILCMIGRLVVDAADSSDAAASLALVSRRWKSIFEENLLVWRSVVLDGPTEETAIVKANYFMSRGPMHHLDVRYHEAESTDELFKILRSRLRGLLHLQTLVLHSPDVPLGKAFDLAARCPALDSLIVHLSNISASALQPPIEGLPLIRHLSVRRRPNTSKDTSSGRVLVPAFTRLSKLEELVLDHPACTLFGRPGESPIVHHLASLRQLSVLDSELDLHPSDLVRTVFIMPQLRGLDLSGSTKEWYIPYLFPLSRPPNTQHLTHLILRGSFFLQTLLVEHLLLLPSLTHLDVRFGRASTRPPIILLHALASHEGAEGDNRRPAHCPRLEELHVTEPTCADETHFYLLSRVVESRDHKLIISSWTEDGTSRWVWPAA